MKVDAEYLASVAACLAANGFAKSKWVEFCEVMLSRGYRVSLAESKTTESKYVEVRESKNKKARRFVVRFSAHRPSHLKELAERPEKLHGHRGRFYVGKSHTGPAKSTADAIAAVEEFFGVHATQENAK